MLKRTLLIMLAMASLLSSCIKDEPANPECDIETFKVDPQWLTGEVFIDQANRKVLLYLKEPALNKGIAPALTLTPGATVTPASGDSIFFHGAEPPTYTVTSASGENKKTYTVEVVQVGTWKWAFEKWGLHDQDKYQYPVEEDGSVVWSSGNPGIALSGVKKDPAAYPLRETNDSQQGSGAALLETMKGTFLSELVGIKLFAGSLFLGVFDPSNALTAPLKATKFGQPYRGRPVRFTGYYKYTPGANYQDKAGTIIPNMTDSCAIYAVLYAGSERLDATNIKTSDRIIAAAFLPDGSARPNFTRFDIPFTFIPGKEPKGTMMMAIVASSSVNGDQYRGAIGSRLVLDSLQIISAQ
ncbi:PCMD domain-containing protein [Chitinophaga lutea]